MDFGQAVRLLKQGKRVAREGWNGKGMFLFLVPGSTFTVNRPPLLGIYPEGTVINYHAYIDMKTATGEVVPWLASQTDVLAEDWVTVPDQTTEPLELDEAMEIKETVGYWDAETMQYVEKEIIKADIDLDGPPEFR